MKISPLLPEEQLPHFQKEWRICTENEFNQGKNRLQWVTVLTHSFLETMENLTILEVKHRTKASCYVLTVEINDFTYQVWAYYSSVNGKVTYMGSDGNLPLSVDEFGFFKSVCQQLNWSHYF